MRTGALSLASGVALALAWVLASACSALVSHADSQCAADGDCARFGAFSCVQGGCVARAAPVEAGPEAAPPSGPCTSTAQCLAAHDGVDWICRHADGTCVSLLSPDCPTILGQYTSDDAVLLGALLPLDGPHASTGAALTDALRLAVSDFDVGIPSPDGGASRPLAILVCNESTDVDRAATHMLGDLLLPAIVGTGDSASTLGVAHDVLVPGGALLMSPRATADLSGVAGSGLVWRTCGSDAVEGAAMVALADGVVLPAVVAASQLSSVRLALLHATDVESTELDAIVTASLILDGSLATDPANAAQFIHVDFGDPDSLADVDAAGRFDAAVAAVTASASLPDVILLLGSTQAVTEVLTGIERAWPAGARLPQYVVSSGLQTSELLALASADTSLSARLLGTAPGGAGANVDTFYASYGQAFADGTSPQIFGVAEAYDAVYALALAEAVVPRADPVGTDVAGALRLALAPRDGSAAVPIDVGPGAIPAAFSALALGQSLTLNGASGPLDFGASGQVSADVQVWCMVQGSTPGSSVFQRSGLSYGASQGALQGAVGAGCQP